MKESEPVQGNNYYRNFFVVLIFSWILLLFFIGFIAYDDHAAKAKKRFGRQAVALAVDIAERFEIDKSEYERLLSLEFNELLKDPVNIEFERKARKVMEYCDVKYIYIESLLPSEKIKYSVGKSEEEKYDKKEGAPLNVVYLLDAVISDEVRMEDTNGKWYVDKDRYTVEYSTYDKVYESKEPAYIINNDEWGEYITGYAPVFDSEGDCYGLVGVDIFIDGYLNSLKESVRIISGFILVNIVFCMIAMSLVTKIKEAEKKVYEKTLLSNIDSLTSVFTRRRFMELLEFEWNESVDNGEGLGLMLVDVDYFKEFNDNNGHVEGDEVLRAVGSLLIENSKKYSGFAGRYGGDEFIVLFPNMKEPKLRKVANEIVRDTMALGIEHNHSPICPKQTVSVGAVYMVPDGDKDIMDFIAMADKALYKSKRYGRNRASIWEKSS